jgi:hypothetical protein
VAPWLALISLITITSSFTGLNSGKCESRRQHGHAARPGDDTGEIKPGEGLKQIIRCSGRVAEKLEADPFRLEN